MTVLAHGVMVHGKEGMKYFNLTTHLTHFIYGYMASKQTRFKKNTI